MEKIYVAGLDADTLKAAQDAYAKVNPDNLDDKDDKKDAPAEEKQDTGEEKDEGEEVKEQPKVKAEPEPKDKPKSDDDIVNLDDKDLTEPELARKKEILEFQVNEEKRVLEADDAKLSKDDLEFKKEILKSKEDAAKTVSPEKEFEDEVRTYAKEHNLSEDEVVAEMDTSKKILEKHAGNALKTARALLYLQKAYSKTSNELKELKELADAPQEIPATYIKNIIESGNLVIKGERLTKERVVSLYRADNPKVAEMLDDDQVLELASQKIADVNAGNINAKKIDITEKAKTKRIELLSKLSERGKKYLPEIKNIVDIINDRAITNDGFNIAEIENMVIGSKVADIERAAYERGVKEGKEKARIVRIPVGGTSGAKVASHTTISDADRKLAMRMYGDMSEEEAIRNFLLVKPSM
jgi:hypothetical protein